MWDLGQELLAATSWKGKLRLSHTAGLQLLSDCDDCSAPTETNCCAFK